MERHWICRSYPVSRRNSSAVLSSEHVFPSLGSVAVAAVNLQSLVVVFHAAVLTVLMTHKGSEIRSMIAAKGNRRSERKRRRRSVRKEKERR